MARSENFILSLHGNKLTRTEKLFTRVRGDGGRLGLHSGSDDDERRLSGAEEINVIGGPVDGIREPV